MTNPETPGIFSHLYICMYDAYNVTYVCVIYLKYYNKK